MAYVFDALGTLLKNVCVCIFVERLLVIYFMCTFVGKCWWWCLVSNHVQLLQSHGCQTPPSMEFSRQEYWSGLPFPSPGDLPDPGIEPGSPTLQADALPSELPICLGSAILLNFVIVLGWCFIFL